MTQATFTIPALEFTPAFFEQIRPFLQGTDIEVFVQVRQKVRRARKNGKLPTIPPKSNGQVLPTPNGVATSVPEPFVKKYPSQPTPEEADKILAEMVSFQKQRPIGSPIEFLKVQNSKPIDEQDWVRRATALNIEEPIEELLALLTK